MHQPADRVVGAPISVGFLVDAAGLLGAKDHARAALVGLELVERVLELPALVVEPAELVGGRLLGLEDRRDQPVTLLGASAGAVIELILHDADPLA